MLSCFRMPPKRTSSTTSSFSVRGRRSSSWTAAKPPSAQEKAALSNMFKRIESSDQTLVKCSKCDQMVKSCLMRDHLETKCVSRLSNRMTEDELKKELDEIRTMTRKRSNEELIVIEDDNESQSTSCKQEEEAIIDVKKLKTEQDLESKPGVKIETIEDQENKLLKEYIEKEEAVVLKQTQTSPSKLDADYYLRNFTNAIETVLNEATFSCLFDQTDFDVIKRFSMLSVKSKSLYVRLFQRKHKWNCLEQINYEQIATDLIEYLDELTQTSFLVNETAITTYEEIIYLFKLPQLKELARVCHVGGGQTNLNKTRAEFIKLILQHFKSQKMLKFHLKAKKISKQETPLLESPSKGNFMNQCKKLLGKCWKLADQARNLFGRILTLYSLSSTHNFDPSKKESGQQQLMQLVLVNLGKVKFMPYEVNIKQPIFSSRDSVLRYHEALDHECELLSLIDSKELAEAHSIFSPRVFEYQKIILDPDLNEFDSALPVYLRVFTAGSVLAKLLSLLAFEVLQKLKMYSEANEIFEFLLYNQTTYLLTWRSKWYERLSMNYEIYLKDPLSAFEVLKKGLRDVQFVKKAGRLALSSRLEKMAETKKYSKIDGLKEELKQALTNEKYDFIQAPTVEIEGTILHSEFIPGRKNVFIEDADSQSIDESSNDAVQEPESGTQIQPTQRSSKPLIKGVEQVALNHYIHKTNAYTHGKHAETATLRTLFGLVFWDIIFDSSVPDVFVDRFQSAPLDLQTEHFYQNRKQLIDSKLELLENAPIEFICELVSQTWQSYRGLECALVSWDLFDSLDEVTSLMRCFTGNQIHALCKYMSQNFRYCRSGGPDLVVWSVTENKVKFVEVKGPGDRLSFKQMVWLDFMIRSGIECEVCHVKGKNSKRLRELDE